MAHAPKTKEFYQALAQKKKDFPALIILSKESCVVYTHYGTGPKYNEVFAAFESFHDQPIGTSLLASLTDNDRKALQNWLDILYDETYVELMMPEDILKLCPSFSLTWTDGENYEVRFEPIKTKTVYEYVLAWLEPHGQTQQQQLAAEIIELMSELRKAPREVINNLTEYLPEVSGYINLSNYTDIEDSTELLNQLSRHLHAAKGTTFFMGFTTLGNACHDVESKLEELRETWTLENGVQPIRDVFSRLYLLLNLAEGISTKVYTANQEEEEGSLTIPIPDYYQIVDLAKAIHKHSQQLPEAQKHFYQDMSDLYHGLIRFDTMVLTTLFERLNNSTIQLSKELNKSVTFSVTPTPPTIHLPHRLFDSLWNALYQVLKNAIDHGAEPEETRKSLGKSSFTQIVLSVEVLADQLVLRLRDDGKGLNPQSIIETALKRKLISLKEAKKLESSESSDEAYQLLFLPGFSTQTEVTTISGRGMGTDVMRQEVKAYSGDIRINSKEGEWTEFTLTFPIQNNHIIIETPTV